MVAVPGNIGNLTLQAEHILKDKFIHLDWVKPPQLYLIKDEIKESKFDDLQGFLKHSYTRHTRHETYRFIKYMDYEQSKRNTKLRNEAFKSSLFGYPDINCTNTKTKSKSFSWQDALLLCRNINATLPEFNSRKEQEEFIAVIKSGDIFPIEAVYIGLYRNTEVSLHD